MSDTTGGTLVYLYGPPAVGKLTVATELARTSGFRLFHNHLTADAPTPVLRLAEILTQHDPRPLGRADPINQPGGRRQPTGQIV